MGQFTITLPDPMEKQVREYAAAHGYGGVSDFVREAVREKLQDMPYWRRFAMAVALDTNRLMRLATNKPWAHQALLEALEEGYGGEYSQAHTLVKPAGLSEETARYVTDVLMMFAQLQAVVNIAGAESLKPAVQFRGFCAEENSAYQGYVSYLVRQGKFTAVKPLDIIPNIRATEPVDARYTRMLSAYQDIQQSKPKGGLLTIDEVEKILRAAGDGA